ncbi:MAG: hypothetical protein HPY52_15050 [Firmicutes bacterium]|nr:hypothetical protein [Bacillota bacterium]
MYSELNFLWEAWALWNAIQDSLQATGFVIADVRTRSLDKRTPAASLPGPDLVGFHRSEQTRFLFGEVKSSSQDDPRGGIQWENGQDLCPDTLYLDSVTIEPKPRDLH